VPKYVYECKECGFVKEIIHSMKEKLKDCSECDTINSLMRIPSFNFLRMDIADDSTTGGRVKEFIEDAREELKQERKDLVNREYNND